MNLIPINENDEHYHICKVWLENKDITKWFPSALRFAKYPKIMHELLITNKKNKLFFINLNDKPVGLVGLINIDKIDNRAELWCFIGDESNRDKNIATQVINLVKNIALQDLKLTSLYALVVETNAPALKLVEKIKFQYVGKFRNAFFIDGSYKDFLIFDWINPQMDNSFLSLEDKRK